MNHHLNKFRIYICFWTLSRHQGGCSFSGCRRIWNEVEPQTVDSVLGMLKKDVKHKCEEFEGQHQRSQSEEQFWCHFLLQLFPSTLSFRPRTNGKGHTRTFIGLQSQSLTLNVTIVTVDSSWVFRNSFNSNLKSFLVSLQFYNTQGFHVSSNLVLSTAIILSLLFHSCQESLTSDKPLHL